MHSLYKHLNNKWFYDFSLYIVKNVFEQTVPDLCILICGMRITDKKFYGQLRTTWKHMGVMLNAHTSNNLQNIH